MLRIILALAITLATTSAFASEWMGSLSFTSVNWPGPNTANWTASLKNGKGAFEVNGNKFGTVERSNSFFIVSSGSGVIGTGMVYKGHVTGVFKVNSRISGTFEGDRTSKGKSKK